MMNIPKITLNPSGIQTKKRILGNSTIVKNNKIYKPIATTLLAMSLMTIPISCSNKGNDKSASEVRKEANAPVGTSESDNEKTLFLSELLTKGNNVKGELGPYAYEMYYDYNKENPESFEGLITITNNETKEITKSNIQLSKQDTSGNECYAIKLQKDDKYSENYTAKIENDEKNGRVLNVYDNDNKLIATQNINDDMLKNTQEDEVPLMKSLLLLLVAGALAIFSINLFINTLHNISVRASAKRDFVKDGVLPRNPMGQVDYLYYESMGRSIGGSGLLYNKKTGKFEDNGGTRPPESWIRARERYLKRWERIDDFVENTIDRVSSLYKKAREIHNKMKEKMGKFAD